MTRAPAATDKLFCHVFINYSENGMSELGGGKEKAGSGSKNSISGSSRWSKHSETEKKTSQENLTFVCCCSFWSFTNGNCIDLMLLLLLLLRGCIFFYTAFHR